MSNWYKLNSIKVLQELNTDVAQGLSKLEASHRLKKYGFNELIERNIDRPWQILWRQLTATMVLILVVAAIISAILGDFRDAIAILAIVVFNSLLGFKQEYQAQQSLAALKKLAVPTVRVRRNAIVEEIAARELVPGDIVMLEAGNIVPADCRLLESASLRIQEASRTGESEPIDKSTSILSEVELPLAERLNLIYMGTSVTYGRGLAVVTETGMKTELGQIAVAIQTVGHESTRLQQRLEALGRVLGIGILVLVTVIFILGLLRGEELKLMFLTAVSLGVAAIPEGLPAVVTIALALGAQRMLKRKALIRKLPAVETLGSVTTICSDKTGTLTENCMTVSFLAVAGQEIDLTELLDRGTPIVNDSESQSALLTGQPALTLLLIGAALCNDALLTSQEDNPHHFYGMGDPTESALVVAAARLGLWKENLEDVFLRRVEIPFDAERKRMTTVHELPKDNDRIPQSLKSILPGKLVLRSEGIAFTKGAVDSLLEVTSQVWIDGQTEPLNDNWQQRILQLSEGLAQNGMRVLGVALKPLESLPAGSEVNSIEQNLTFIGMVGMLDPARPEVKYAVQTCQTAGIRPVMITGDHPLTAMHIARELGVSVSDRQASGQHRFLTGQDLEPLSDNQLADIVESVSVYARVSPQQKLTIVRALQSRGQVVAMTGDGVNDAPALKQADIGVAMGITGTDVAKQTADMILLDDNFATIVAAIKEGRVIYDNIRKFVKYSLTGNCGELWVIILAPVWGMPLPLLPLQILWINLLADGLLALALSVEPGERKIMQRRPCKPNESIFGRGVGRDIVWVGLLLGLVLLAVAYGYWSNNQASWQTMVFTTLAFSRIGLAQTMRSERDSLFSIGLLGNKPLLGAVFLTFSLQLAVVYTPWLQNIFQTTALSKLDLTVSLVLSSIVLFAMEIDKLIRYSVK